MTAHHLLALDVGTQSVRAIVFDIDGRIVGRAQTVLEPAFESPQPGWAEQDPEIYWQALRRSCQMLWAAETVRPEEIAGLALTTQRGTVVCVDAEGRTLRPAIGWADQRLCTAPPKLGPVWTTLFRATGASGLIAHLQAQAECNWLAQHEPDLWRRTDKFVLLSAWLTRRLVGAWVDSVACQVGYIPFDYRRLEWARPFDWHWKALAVRPGQMPRLIAPATPLGSLDAAAAEALGLPRGLAVIAAAADKACEVLGCGALEPDAAQLSFGTAATINTTQAKYLEAQRMLPPYPAALPGHYNTEISILRGFAMVTWFKHEFAQAERELAAARGVSAESLFDALIASVPPGAMGLTLQPYWSPGLRDPGPEGKGAIIGFGEVHTRAHFYRAIIEGLAYGLRAGREQIEKRTGRPLRTLHISGGGSQSDGAMQITADVFAMPAQRPEVHETSALGAAMLCAVGLKLHADVPAAVRAMSRVGRVFEPEPGAVRTYDALYREVYRELYPRLKPLYRRIRAITGYPP